VEEPDSDERQHREEICRFGKLLHERGYVAATDGNLSVRLGDGNILVTPTGMCKSMMEADDMVVVDLDGRQVSGRRGVTSEIGMHLLIYRMRPDIQAVVHAHPPTATGFAACGQALDQPLVSEIVVALGCVPLAKYGTPGTPELAEALEPLIPEYDAMLMANHGVVAYAENLEKAYMKMETVEHFAKITLVSRTVGESLVDELILSFTHDCEMPAILPDIKPTGRKVVVPTVVIVGFDQDSNITHEHIYWDQASMLVQLGLRAEETPRPGIVHLRPRGLQLVSDGARNLHAVAVSLHVVQKRDDAHACEVHGARLQRMAGGRLERLGAARDGLARVFLSRVMEASPGPVAVRGEHRGEAAGLVLRAVETAGHEMAGHALEHHFVDHVVVALDRAVHARVERRTRRPGPEPERYLNLPPQRRRALLPFRQGRRRAEWAVRVEIADPPEPPIVGPFAGREYSQRWRLAAGGGRSEDVGKGFSPADHSKRQQKAHTHAEDGSLGDR